MRARRLIIRNSARCLICLDEIESTHRNDFVQCSCGRLAVDGGQTWLRRVYAVDAKWEETSIVKGRDK